jgi:alkylhydroperoxidase family enzyme
MIETPGIRTVRTHPDHQVPERSSGVSSGRGLTVRQHYTDRQITETITLTGNYFLIARLTTVLNIPLDPPPDDAVLRAGLAMHNGFR